MLSKKKKEDEMINNAIYRAKGLGSEEYVEGFYAFDECHKRHLILVNKMHGLSECRIDPSTLSIHFPDMLDSDGNKIFASLSEDGKGGDTINFEHHNKTCKRADYFVCYIEKNIAIRSMDKDNFWLGSTSLKNIKIVGIKQ